MKNFNRDGGGDRNFGGDRKFGGDFKKRSFGGGGGFGGDRRDRGDRPEMFKAICAECGAPCEVPFKPSGNRPVLCSNCFKGSARPEGRREERRFGEKPSFGGTHEFHKPADNGKLEERLGAINDKLDKLIKLLSPAQAPEPIKVIKESKPEAKSKDIRMEKVQKKEIKKAVKKPIKKSSKK